MDYASSVPSLSRERAALKIPLSLSVYEHAAALIGRTPWDVSRDADLLCRAHAAAYETYRHFPVVVGVDIYNIEAEAYGCTVQRPSGTGIPAITEHPFASLGDALNVEPFDPSNAGRVPMLLKAGRRLKETFPDADIRIPLSGPFSIAQNLLGLTELILGIASEPDRVRALLHRLVPGQLGFARAIRETGLDVAFFESAAAPPLLSPAHFREIELDPLKEAICGVAEIMGHAVPCIIGGDTVRIIPEMLATGTDFLICPAETDRIAFLDATAERPDVRVRVNIDPAIYTRGTHDDIGEEIDAVVALANGRENVLLGTGAVPYEAPVENLLFMKQYCEA